MTSTPLPTVDELNTCTSSEVFLLILRALCTSDLAFTHMLFDESTTTDISRKARNILKLELDANVCTLSAEEQEEFLVHCNQIAPGTVSQ